MRQRARTIFRFKKRDIARSARILVPLIALVVVGLVGMYLLSTSHANSTNAKLEAKAGQIKGCAGAVTDSTAATGGAIKFKACPAPPPPPVSTAGAKLPITYSLTDSSLGLGTIRYISTSGCDTATGSCTNDGTTPSKAWATLAYAIKSGANTVVVMGGTYLGQNNINITQNNIKIWAYPGQTPIFKDSVAVGKGSSWTAEGSTLKWRSYIARPIANGSGVNYSVETDMTNLNDTAGRYPDQVWIGNTALKQVAVVPSGTTAAKIAADAIAAKKLVTNGKFWVDRTNNKLYMTASDIANPAQIEVSRPGTGNVKEKDSAVDISGHNVDIEGITFDRYSPNANDYGVVRTEATADNLTLKNDVINYAPYTAISLNHINSPKVQNITFDNVGWMGITGDYVDGATIDSSLMTDMDPFDQFKGSPGSGDIKLTHTWTSAITNNDMERSNSHAVWCDQSCYKLVFANNRIIGTTGNALFFEISDDLLFVNNYIKQAPNARAGVKISGSSDVRLINNTIVGGGDGIGVYTDNRSYLNCKRVTPAAPAKPYCVHDAAYPNCARVASNCPYWYASSDPYNTTKKPTLPDGSTRVLPATLDWIPRITEMYNNVIAYPDDSGGSGLCGSGSTHSLVPNVCITLTNQDAVTTVPRVIHKQDYPYAGLPQTYIDDNIYATNYTRLYTIGGKAYTTLTGSGGFTAAMAASPVSIGGLEVKGKYSNALVATDGTVSSSVDQSTAIAIPNDNAIKPFITPGTKHYGVTYK